MQALKTNDESPVSASGGPQVTGSNVRREPLSRKRAMVWCAVLGAFGAHRFYLGQAGLGWLYLAFSWTFVPFVAAIVDFVFLAMQDDEDFAEEQREIPLIQPPRYERPVRFVSGMWSEDGNAASEGSAGPTLGRVKVKSGGR